jgi:hypothetical protein
VTGFQVKSHHSIFVLFIAPLPFQNYLSHITAKKQNYRVRDAQRNIQGAAVGFGVIFGETPDYDRQRRQQKQRNAYKCSHKALPSNITRVLPAD